MSYLEFLYKKRRAAFQFSRRRHPDVSGLDNEIKRVEQLLAEAPKTAQRYEDVMADPETYSDPEDPELFESYRYFSIGQMDEEDGEKSYCWIYDGRNLLVEQGGTHAMNFPNLFSWKKHGDFKGYRGWYDPNQKMISVVIPRERGQVDPALEASSLPTKLRVALADKFGTDNQIMVF